MYRGLKDNKTNSCIVAVEYDQYSSLPLPNSNISCSYSIPFWRWYNKKGGGGGTSQLGNYGREACDTASVTNTTKLHSQCFFHLSIGCCLPACHHHHHTCNNIHASDSMSTPWQVDTHLQAAEQKMGTNGGKKKIEHARGMGLARQQPKRESRKFKIPIGVDLRRCLV